MGEGKGAGASRYNGLRVTLICVPNTARGYVSVTRKHWRDGWDTWAAISPMKFTESVKPRNDLDALEIMYETLGEMLREERSKI
jgi:hypothetical protein